MTLVDQTLRICRLSTILSSLPVMFHTNLLPSNYNLRTLLLFCFQLKKSASETHEMIMKSYGEHALSRAQCFKWFEIFRSGGFNVEN